MQTQTSEVGDRITRTQSAPTQREASSVSVDLDSLKLETWTISVSHCVHSLFTCGLSACIANDYSPALACLTGLLMYDQRIIHVLGLLHLHRYWVLSFMHTWYCACMYRILSRDWSHSSSEVPCQRFLVHCVGSVKHLEGGNVILHVQLHGYRTKNGAGLLQDMGGGPEQLGVAYLVQWVLLL